ncbi:MAG: ATP-dependent zinc metalloprotease FtsH [Selenomonas montiformis]|nr:ATP-dependent zinc metalloprotease FtsH [Selenomonas montiformis]
MDNNPNGNRPDNNKGPGKQDPNKNHQSILAFLVCLLITLVCFAMFTNMLKDNSSEITYDEFIEMVEDGDVKEVTLQSETLTITPKHQSSGFSEDVYYANQMESVDKLTERLEGTGIKFEYKKPDAAGEIISMLVSVLLPTILLFVLLMVFMRRMNKGGGMMGVGKSRAKAYIQKDTGITFKDVAGQDEAKESLQEVVDFLHNPGKYTTIGAKLPKGALLVGPPGTGKTLLAKAVAGEAHVPFFSLSGSEFVEMFVGVGASRVRDLFDQAKKNAPCIVFIDEIDAVGRQRGAGVGGGHDEREQTLNQLLVEMDGFAANEGIIIIAATNRPDILDPALLRPGRFDRQIVVDKPDVRGRLAILKVHTKGKPVAGDVDLDILARRTPGFTGADLSNLVNEAALLAARRDKKKIGMGEMEEAIERVMAGPERKSHIMNDEEKRLTAYHEGGHTLVGMMLKHADPVHKVTIIPRGRAGGYTLMLPKEDRNYATKSELLDRLKVAMGGRVAEEIVLKEISTGASQDIQQATRMVRGMIMQYGMSDVLGPVAYGESQNHQVFLGRDFNHERNYSEEVASEIDKEVRKYLEAAYEACRQIITDNRDKLELIAQELMERETLTAKQLEELLTTGRLSDDDAHDDEPEDNGPRDGDPAPVSPELVSQQEQGQPDEAVETDQPADGEESGTPKTAEPKFNVTHYDK